LQPKKDQLGLWGGGGGACHVDDTVVGIPEVGGVLVVTGILLLLATFIANAGVPAAAGVPAVAGELKLPLRSLLAPHLLLLYSYCCHVSSSAVAARVICFCWHTLPPAAGILAAADDTSVAGIPGVADVLPVSCNLLMSMTSLLPLKCCFWCPCSCSLHNFGIHIISTNLSFKATSDCIFKR
jgi:hypothetical protein